MKLLIYGHWSHTGFGVVTEAIGGGLVERGVDVRVLAMNHRGEPVKGRLAGRVWPFETLAGYHLRPSSGSIDGSMWRALDPDDDWKPDALLVIADMSGLLNYVADDRGTWSTLPVFHYCPIEGDDLPPLWRQVWEKFLPIAMSDYGQRVISEHIGSPVPRIYHGVDTDTFYPVSPGKPIRFDGGVMRTKEDCKQKFGMDPDRKVILRADRNVVRKNYPELLRAFVPIARADPDVDLVLHCRHIDPEGPDLLQEMLRLPEDIRERIKFTGAHDTFRGLSPAGLNALYNAADLYLSTTGGEGFGLTLAESLAAGVPVVTTAWAAEKEVVAEGGVLVPPLQDSHGQPVRYHSRFGMDWAVPDPAAFTKPVLDLLAHKNRRRALGAEGRLHVVRTFSWDRAADQFADILTKQPVEAAA